MSCNYFINSINGWVKNLLGVVRLYNFTSDWICRHNVEYMQSSRLRASNFSNRYNFDTATPLECTTTTLILYMHCCVQCFQLSSVSFIIFPLSNSNFDFPLSLRVSPLFSPFGKSISKIAS